MLRAVSPIYIPTHIQGGEREMAAHVDCFSTQRYEIAFGLGKVAWGEWPTPTKHSDEMRPPTDDCRWKPSGRASQPGVLVC